MTNPPIDAIREEVVTDTTVYIGDDGNLLQEKAENCKVLQVRNPILTSTDLMKIRHRKARLPCGDGFHPGYKNTPLKRALDHLFVAVDRAYRNVANIVILSDRGVDEKLCGYPIPLLAVSAIEQYLDLHQKSVRWCPFFPSPLSPGSVHHFATLLGYGARAINPIRLRDHRGAY